MPNQGDIRAGRAFVEVFTDDSKLQQGLIAINKRMDAWSQQLSGMGMKAMAVAGALSLPFITGAKVFSSFGDQIEKMTYRTGMGSEALSEISYAAQICGTDIKSVEVAIKGMQKTLSGAADELGSAEKKLAKLGLTLGDLDGKKPEEQFFILLERLRDIKDENIRAATALAIFGKSGTQLLPMIAAGSKGIAELREEARKLGVSLSKEDAQSASDLTGEFVKMKTALMGVSLAIGSAVAPAVRTVTQFFTDNVAAISTWLREHKSVVVVSGLAVAALGAVGVTLLSLGGIAKVTSIGIYGLAAAFGILRMATLAPIGMMAALTTGAVMFSTQIIKSTVSLFGMVRGLGTFSRMATSAGATAGILAKHLAGGLFNTAVALPGVFARMQGVINKTLTSMIAMLSKLAGANTLQQGFNGLLLFFAAMPSLVRGYANRTAVFLKNGFLAAISSIKSGWNTVIVSAQSAWAATVAITKSSVATVIAGTKIGFLAVASSIKSVIIAAKGLTAMAVIQKSWNATIFVTQSLLRGLRAGLMAVTSVNVAGLLSQGIAAVAFQLSALATTAIPAVVSALAGMAAYALPVVIGIGAAVAAGVALWQYFGDSVKSAFMTAMESAKWFLGWIGSGLQTMYGDFSKYMGMMGDMLANGDLAGAASVMWKLIQLEWNKGCLAI
ncbi:MAG: phage tail tape measure protein [Planctomycetaceae bacterium]|nr:phage tail tape measure protein [Planctomycetaceae bacterium]